jgi:hypothetical protein
VIVVVLVVIVVVAGILLFAATRPDAYGIQRVTTIGAPPERILPLLIDKQWPNWSPFEALDPTMERTYSGAPTGKGAVYEWEGNRQAGKGRMEIVDVSPPKSVTIHVDFVKPFDAHNINQFTLEPRGNATVVTWSMRGTQPFALKAMSIFVSPDRLLGKHFETGLANLKATAERNA